MSSATSAPVGKAEEPAKTGGGDDTNRPWRVLLALGLSLVGFVTVAVLVYAAKYLGAGPTVFDLPSRDLWVLGLMLAVTPILMAVFQRVSILFLLPPIALIFLLYPLFSPFGLPYDRDVIYNFQFAYVLLQTGHWAPGAGVTGPAITYSYYPASGVFNAEFASVTGVPIVTSVLWATPLFRLLALPPAVYALGKRMFNERVGMLGLLLVMGTPSILFDISVQQEFAVPYLALTFLLMAYVVMEPSITSSGVIVAFVLCSSFIVISHHLTSYVALAWLAGFLVIALVLGRKGAIRWTRVAPLFAVYLGFFAAYTYFVSAPSFLAQVAQVGPVLSGLVSSSPAGASPAAAGIGLSFSLYQQIWVYGSFLLIIITSILGLAAFRRSKGWGFVGVNVIVALVLTFVSIPFLATPFSFLVLRVMEWAGLFLMPMSAWWLAQRLSPHPAPSQATAMPTLRVARPRWRGYAGPLVAIGVILLVFTGGSLTPYSSRDQFASTTQIANDSPVLIDQNDYSLAVWAHSHLTGATLLWGDYYTFSVFGGFGRFNMTWNQYLIFNGTTVSETAWAQLRLGDYIVVDQYMTTKTPSFYGPGTDQPAGPLSVAQVTKFNDPTYFDRVFNNSEFTIYMVIQLV
jgi:hypothetical protein